MRIKQLIRSYLSTPKYLFRNIDLRIIKSVSKLNVIFIVGAPRSGTTLLHTLISSHTKCFTVQTETAIFTWKNLYGNSHFKYNLSESHDCLNASKDVVDFFDKSVRELEEYDENLLFVEKTPQHINHLKKLERFFVNAKFVVISRDVRDCYLSCFAVDTMRQFRNVRFFANYWNNCIQNGLKFHNNKKVFYLRYEDLVRDAAKELGQVMRFLNLELEDMQIDPKVYGKDIRAEKKHFKKLSKKIDASSVARWKKELGDECRWILEKKCGKNLERLGYKI